VHAEPQIEYQILLYSTLTLDSQQPESAVLTVCRLSYGGSALRAASHGAAAVAVGGCHIPSTRADGGITFHRFSRPLVDMLRLS
jgi:hypothetical protein